MPFGHTTHFSFFPMRVKDGISQANRRQQRKQAEQFFFG
jgi:hypothetical protein